MPRPRPELLAAFQQTLQAEYRAPVGIEPGTVHAAHDAAIGHTGRVKATVPPGHVLISVEHLTYRQRCDRDAGVAIGRQQALEEREDRWWRTIVCGMALGVVLGVAVGWAAGCLWARGG